MLPRRRRRRASAGARRAGRSPCRGWSRRWLSSIDCARRSEEGAVVAVEVALDGREAPRSWGRGTRRGSARGRSASASRSGAGSSRCRAWHSFLSRSQSAGSRGLCFRPARAKGCDRWTSATGWRSGSRSTGPTCGRWPTGCSARSARPTTPCRRPGCGSAAPTPSGVENLGGWLTTVVARVCLNMLRSRSGPARGAARDARLPDPVVSARDGADPEHEALLADSVGLALLVVLETLAPAERLAFVLHDMFAVPFDEIAPIVGRSPTAARQLASRARRRVRGAAAGPRRRPARQRAVVDAFLAAARERRLRRARRGARPRRRAPRRPTAPCRRARAGPRRAGGGRAGAHGSAQLAPARPAGAGQRRRRAVVAPDGRPCRGPRLHRVRTAGSSRSTSSPTPSGSASSSYPGWIDSAPAGPTRAGHALTRLHQPDRPAGRAPTPRRDRDDQERERRRRRSRANHGRHERHQPEPTPSVVPSDRLTGQHHRF